jgi:hypothetical protein
MIISPFTALVPNSFGVNALARVMLGIEHRLARPVDHAECGRTFCNSGIEAGGVGNFAIEQNAATFGRDGGGIPRRQYGDMGVGQGRPMGIRCQRRFAVEYLEPGQALRRHRQAGFTAGAKRQPVEQNAGSRYTVLGKQVLTCAAVYRRLGGDRAFIENRGHDTP